MRAARFSIVRVKSAEAGITPRRDREMPEPPDRVNPILPTQKLLGINPLNPPIHIVQEHVRHPLPLPTPRHHRRRVDRAHPPRQVSGVAPRRIDHDQIPLPLIHLLRQVAERQLAPDIALEGGGGGEEAGGLGAVGGEEAVGVGEARAIADGVGTEGRGVF